MSVLRLTGIRRFEDPTRSGGLFLGEAGKVMAGLRYARNSVHHQWADALRLDEGGVSFPLEFPVRFSDWYWRREIPPPRNRKGELEYNRLLAGEPTRNALSALRELFPTALAELSRRLRRESGD
jgi:hypothetical protein